MKVITVYESIKVRSCGLDRYSTWGKWKTEEGEFDEVVEKYRKESASKDFFGQFQVAKFYYSMDNKYIGWDEGVLIYAGQVDKG